MAIRDDLTAAMAPWLTPDLQTYLESVGDMFAEVEEFVEVTEDGSFLDPDLTPERALPYLAQYVGERLPKGITEAAAREWVKDAPHQRRGTLRAIFYAAQRTLTGTRLVTIRERDGAGTTDNPDRLSVYTYTSQTPDAAQVLRDLQDVVPADIVLDYQAIAGQTWQDVSNHHPTWADVNTDHDNWGDVTAEMSGSSSFSRPPP